MQLVERGLQKLSRKKREFPAHGVVWGWRSPNHLSKKTQTHATVPKRYHNWHPPSKHKCTCWAKNKCTLKSVLQVSHLWCQGNCAGSLGQGDTVRDASRGTERSADAPYPLQMGIPKCSFNTAMGFKQSKGQFVFLLSSDKQQNKYLKFITSTFLFWFCYFFPPIKWIPLIHKYTETPGDMGLNDFNCPWKKPFGRKYKHDILSLIIIGRKQR